ncbi:helix-turn-helix transcriptional regulator [Sinomonas soli]
MTERPTPRTRDDFPEILLTRQEAATYLGLSKAWLAKMACRGIGPAYYKLPGGTVRYELEALRRWAGVTGKKAA